MHMVGLKKRTVQTVIAIWMVQDCKADDTWGNFLSNVAWELPYWNGL